MLTTSMRFDAADRLQEIASRLAEVYGRPTWRSHAPPLDELVATVLSQHTSDTNTELAGDPLRCRPENGCLRPAVQFRSARHAVDTHIHRVGRRLGLIEFGLSAENAHKAMDQLIGPDRDAVYSLHLNLIRHGRAICKARAPRCGQCVLADICPSAGTIGE